MYKFFNKNFDIKPTFPKIRVFPEFEGPTNNTLFPLVILFRRKT